MLSLILGAIRRDFMVLVPLKWIWIPLLLHVLLNLSPGPWDVRYHYVDIVVCSTIVVVGLVVSRSLSIVDVMFAIKFVL